MDLVLIWQYGKTFKTDVVGKTNRVRYINKHNLCKFNIEQYMNKNVHLNTYFGNLTVNYNKFIQQNRMDVQGRDGENGYGK